MADSAIILFTKAPIPGLVKTRLIAIDGLSPDANDVAYLYKSLLSDTLTAVKQACEETGAKLIISFFPKEQESVLRTIVEPFFKDALYIPQVGGNVTERVVHAFDYAFSMGFTGVFLVPGDHPDLDNGTIVEAILDTGASSAPRVVLGPTLDGGAYLLGFNAESFRRIRFNLEDTYHVCADIFLKAKSLNIPCSFLSNRNDIDDWDDVQLFLNSKIAPSSKTRIALTRFSGTAREHDRDRKELSVIIPTLNEEKNINNILDSLDRQTSRDFEIVVVDGGSRDGTVSTAISRANKLAFVGNPSRKRQENIGGFGAKGRVLLFLHADSIVSPTLCEAVIRASRLDEVIGGSCKSEFSGNKTRYAFLNALRNCGNRLLKIHGISSGFFVRRRVFLQAHGFSDNVMEEAVDFQKRTRYWGNYLTIEQIILSSPRRFAGKRDFVPTLIVWITTVLLTYIGTHHTSIERMLWKAVR
ncbi:MAG: DUF2064 domain-containing protein [Nitrososphaerota archaeon]|nr:DUF2064 domain-containing protein [Nitrososphaerota archaeon]